jgi:hypothetical protein
VGLTSQLQDDFSSSGLGTDLANYGGAGPTGAGVTIIGTAATALIVASGLYALNITPLTSGSFDVFATIK